MENRLSIKMLALFIVFFFGLTFPEAEAQQSVPVNSKSEESINIPPLRMLIDSAIQYSPLLRSKDIEITIKEMEWRAQRWEWTDFIQPFTEYRYGTIDNLIFAPTGAVLDDASSTAHRFNIGARINLTIFNAINYRSKLALADKRIELDQSRRKEIELLVTQEVIRLYTSLITSRDIAFIKSEYVETQAMNLAEAELRYKTGEVPIMEMARVAEIATKAKEDYELTKKEFREAMFLLFELVGKGDFTKWTEK